MGCLRNNENEEPLGMLSNEERTLLRKLEQISSLAPYCQRPPEGWICALGKAFGLNKTKLANKLLLSEEALDHIEETNTLVFQRLNQIATVFGGRFQHVFVPKNLDNLEKVILTNDTPSQVIDSLKEFENLPPLPQKPSNGWIQFFRLARGMTTDQLAKKLHITESALLDIENAEIHNELFNPNLMGVVSALGCRLEYFFIPNDGVLLQNPPAIQPFLEQLAHFSSLSIQPTHGWIHTMLKLQGISKPQLSKWLNVRESEISRLEIAEQKNTLMQTFNKHSLNKIAKVLGCQLKYCFIQKNSLYKQKTLAKFEIFPSFDKKTNIGTLSQLRKALGVSRPQVAKALKIHSQKLIQLEKMEARGDIFHAHVKNIAQSLGCQIKHILIPNESSSNKMNFDKMKPVEALYWNEVRQYASRSSKPIEGWFRYLRTSLEMTSSELATKIGIKEKLILQIEKDEEKNLLIKESLLKLAQILGFRFEYIMVPYDQLKQENIQENTLKQQFSNQESLERFKKLSFLPQKPAEGWARTIREMLGMDQKELAKYTNFSQSILSTIEIAEKKGRITPRPLEAILEILECRAELIFIPENLNFLQNSFTAKRKALQALKPSKPLKPPKLSKTFQPPPQKNLFTFPLGFDQLTLIPNRPPQGWVCMIRKAQGLSQMALTELSGYKNSKISKIEKNEVQNKFISPTFHKVARALGCRADYVFIPNSPSFENLISLQAQNLKKEFELPFQISQTPVKGWISTIQEAFGLTQVELANKINESYTIIRTWEKIESKGRLISRNLKKIAEALDCEIEFLFIPEKIFFEEYSLPYKKHFKKFEQAASLPAKPSEGWIRTIRTSLGMSQLEFSKKINVTAARLSVSELLEINDEAIHPTLKKAAQALDCRINYIFIPEKDSVAEVPLKDSELLMELKQLSSVYAKPPEGWIRTARMLRGMSQLEFKRKANYCLASRYSVEKIEAQTGLIPKHMKAIAQALGGRFDYVLIPMVPFSSQEFYKKLERIASSYHRPSEGWIRLIRKMRRITIAQLAKDIKMAETNLRTIELDDVNNKRAKGLTKVAQALGGRFECVLIPKTPLEPNLLKEYNELSQFPSTLPAKPEGGWIQAIRKARGLSKAQLARIANMHPSQISECEAYEGKNKFFPSSLQKVAQALGGRFEYVLIPDKTPLPRDRSLVIVSCSTDPA